MTSAILHFSSTSCLNLSLVFPSICFGFPFSVIPNLFFSTPQGWLSQEVTFGVFLFLKKQWRKMARFLCIWPIETLEAISVRRQLLQKQWRTIQFNLLYIDGKWTAFIWHFSSLIYLSKHFTLQASFTHSYKTLHSINIELCLLHSHSHDALG